MDDTKDQDSKVIDFNEFKKMREQVLDEEHPFYVFEDEEGTAFAVVPIPEDINPEGCNLFFINDDIEFEEILAELEQGYEAVDAEITVGKLIEDLTQSRKENMLLLQVNQDLEREILMLKSKLELQENIKGE